MRVAATYGGEGSVATAPQPPMLSQYPEGRRSVVVVPPLAREAGIEPRRRRVTEEAVRARSVVTVPTATSVPHRTLDQIAAVRADRCRRRHAHPLSAASSHAARIPETTATSNLPRRNSPKGRYDAPWERKVIATWEDDQRQQAEWEVADRAMRRAESGYAW